MASYQVNVTNQVRKEIRQLPGNIRQRIIHTLQDLQQKPHLSNSRTLDAIKADIKLDPTIELCRIRIESWRIVYVIEEELNLISVLAVRRRPPYQYEDLADLLKNVQP